MVYFLYLLVHSLKIFKSITYLFPVRGHSFLPNDQDFSLISAKKKTATVEVPDQWSDIIKTSQEKPKPFKHVMVTQEFVYNIKKLADPYFKLYQRKIFKLKSLRMFKIESTSSFVKVRDSYNGAWRTVNVQNTKKLPNTLEFEKLYNKMIPINKLKIDYMKNLFPYLSLDSRKYYDNLFSSTSTTNHEPNNEQQYVDLIESDNSSGKENGFD